MTAPTGNPMDSSGSAAVWLVVPTGYAALPLADIPQTLEVTGRLVEELAPPALRAAGRSVLGPLAVMLETLAAGRAVYCGVGRHRSAIDGQVVTSSLVVSLLEFTGARNPRLVLKDLIEAKRDDGETGATDVVDLPNGPVMFFERTLMLPAPPALGQHVLAEGVESPVWQLEAFVPAPDGDKLATIQLSTPFAEHGPQYRAVVVAMASTVSFREAGRLAALAG